MKRLPLNTPYRPADHLPALKSVAPDLRLQGADAWGNSPTNANWAAIEVPTSKGQVTPFIGKCQELGIYFGEDSAYPGYRCFNLCRYEMEV